MINEADFASGVIKCLDQRWRSDGSSYEWHRMVEREWSLQALSARSAEATSLFTELLQLSNDLQTADMMDTRTHPPQSGGG